MKPVVFLLLVLVLLSSCGKDLAPVSTVTFIPLIFVPGSTAASTVTSIPHTFVSNSASVLQADSLRDLAERAGLELGTQLTCCKLYKTDPNWEKILLRDFNSVTIDWGIYWPAEVEKVQGQYDFSIADEQVAYALRNHLTIRGHPLVYGTCVPYCINGWITDRVFSRDEMSEILRNHVTQVVSHFKRRISQWVVVNEAYHPPSVANDIFYNILGWDYIDIAFQAARQADPSAILIYNENGNETSTGYNTSFSKFVIERLKSKGLIDGIGLEMHLNGNYPPDKQDVISTMKSYGLPVYVTEFDVNMTAVPGDQNERLASQAQIYKNMLEACIESGVCKGFTVWGFGDNYSWLKVDRSLPNSDATLFDINLQPKPAHISIADVLVNYLARKHTP